MTCLNLESSGVRRIIDWVTGLAGILPLKMLTLQYLRIEAFERIGLFVRVRCTEMEIIMSNMHVYFNNNTGNTLIE